MQAASSAGAVIRTGAKNINRIEILDYDGGEQAWQVIDMGHETTSWFCARS